MVSGFLVLADGRCCEGVRQSTVPRKVEVREAASPPEGSLEAVLGHLHHCTARITSLRNS